MAMLRMAQPSKPNNASISQQQEVNPMFHDFLGMKATDSPVVLAPKAAANARLAEASPSASASLGASSGGGRGPISSASDLGSVERQVGSHLEGVPFYGPRSEISGPEISKRLAGKRGNSDSAFIGHDSLESLHLMKILRNGPGGDRVRRSNDEEVFFSMQQNRQTSASLILQPPGGNRIDSTSSRWERSLSLNASHALQYPPRGAQFMPFVHQVTPNRSKGANAGPSIISQSAADEGSRTGIKGAGLLSSLNAAAGVSEKNSSGALPIGNNPKTGTCTSEPESSAPPSRQVGSLCTRQMTIFYGGQAHVFDDVHPNKADVIMALAGSNGGSWSTTYSPKSTTKPISENHSPTGELEAVGPGSMPFARDFRGRVSGECVPTHAGGHRGSSGTAKDARNKLQTPEPSSTEEKREV